MTSEEAMAAALDAVRDGDGESTADVARHILAALAAAGFAVVPVAAPECIHRINGSAYWRDMVEAIVAADARRG